MANKGDLAPSTQRLEQRPERWHGHVLGGARSALNPDQLSYLENARLREDEILPRPGLSRANSADPDATITGRVVGLATLDDTYHPVQGGVVLVNSFYSIPSPYPVYGGFQGYVRWSSGDTEPNYYQAYYDFDGFSVTVTTIPRDASLIPANFYPVVVQPVLVGGYWYTILQQIVGVSYDGVGYARQWIVARATPGTSWVYVDYFSAARQLVSTSAATHWSTYSITHDGTDFIMAVRAVDNPSADIYNATYSTHVLRITLDGSTAPEVLGDLIADINPTITSAGGTAISVGGFSPAFGVFYYGGYMLAYPYNGPSTNLDAVGSTKPGYAAYMVKGGSLWALCNPSASPIADGACGRVRWHQVHDGKVYLLTSTDHDLLGDNIMRVWDPGTNPAIISEVFTLSGGRRWITDSDAAEGGGNAVSFQGKLYFSWSTGSEIGVGSWDGTTLVEDVWSETFTVGDVDSVHLMPLRNGLAVVVKDVSYTPDRQKIWYSNGTDLTTWNSISAEGVEANFRALMPEEL